jgi:hypothetical protein
MAIGTGTGTAANSSASVTSLALPSVTPTTGRDIVVVVVLGSTSSSVSSISSSAGSYTSWTLQSSKNGTGVRVEVWTAHVTTGAATIFTVNITGGATSISSELEEYSGVSSFGHTDTATDVTLELMDLGVSAQDGNNWVVTGFGFACQSGDTTTAQIGTERRLSIPAATAVGGALYDNTQPATAKFGNATKLSANRNWAAASVELRSGATAISLVDYGGTLVAALQANRDYRLQHVLEPLFAQQQTYPPSPGANNSGFTA